MARKIQEGWEAFMVSDQIYVILTWAKEGPCSYQPQNNMQGSKTRLPNSYIKLQDNSKFLLQTIPSKLGYQAIKIRLLGLILKKNGILFHNSIFFILHVVSIYQAHCMPLISGFVNHHISSGLTISITKSLTSYKCHVHQHCMGLLFYREILLLAIQSFSSLRVMTRESSNLLQPLSNDLGPNPNFIRGSITRSRVGNL